MLVTLPFVTDGNPHCPCACEIIFCNSCVVLVYVVATYRLEEAVGVADHQVIDNGRLTASSYLHQNDEKAPWKVLDKEWCAANWDTQPWLRIDLSSDYRTITKIEIRGKKNQGPASVIQAFLKMTFVDGKQENVTVLIICKIARLNICSIQIPCIVRISITKVEHIHVLIWNLTSF